MIRLALPVALLFVVAGGNVDAAEVYRCVSETGVVSYSDKPCGEQAEKLRIRSERTDSAAVQERVESRKAQIKELEEAREEASESAAKSEEEAEQRRVKCEQARQRLANLTVARRVTTGEGDDRRYLESEEIIERRQQAQDQVNALCGG